MTDKMKEEPPLVMKCKLFGCTPRNGGIWPEESFQIMKETLKR